MASETKATPPLPLNTQQPGKPNIRSRLSPAIQEGADRLLALFEREKCKLDEEWQHRYDKLQTQFALYREQADKERKEAVDSTYTDMLHQVDTVLGKVKVGWAKNLRDGWDEELEEIGIVRDEDGKLQFGRDWKAFVAGMIESSDDVNREQRLRGQMWPQPLYPPTTLLILSEWRNRNANATQELQQKVAKLEKERQELNATLHTHHTEYQSAINKHSKMVVDLEQQIADVKKAREEREASLRAASLQYSKLQIAVKSTVQSQANTIANLRQQLSDVQHITDRRQDTCTTRSSERPESRATLESQIAAHQTTITELQHRVAEHEKRHKELEASLLAATTQYSEYQARSQSQIDSHDKTWQQRVTEAVKQRRQLWEIVRKQSKGVAVMQIFYKNQLDDQTKIVDQLHGQAANMERENEELKKMIQEKMTSLSQLQEEADRWRTKALQAEAGLQDAQSDATCIAQAASNKRSIMDVCAGSNAVLTTTSAPATPTKGGKPQVKCSPSAKEENSRKAPLTPLEIARVERIAKRSAPPSPETRNVKPRQDPYASISPPTAESPRQKQLIFLTAKESLEALHTSQIMSNATGNKMLPSIPTKPTSVQTEASTNQETPLLSASPIIWTPLKLQIPNDLARRVQIGMPSNSSTLRREPSTPKITASPSQTSLAPYSRLRPPEAGPLPNPELLKLRQRKTSSRMERLTQETSAISPKRKKQLPVASTDGEVEDGEINVRVPAAQPSCGSH